MTAARSGAGNTAGPISADRDYLKISREKLEILWYGKKKFEENKEYLQPEAKKN